MNQHSLNILIVDDDNDDAMLLTDALQAILPSCNFHYEKNGLAALQFLTKNAPDLVFLDLNLPMRNGIECMKEIYQKKLLPNTPTVIYSTSDNQEEIDEAYKYGAGFYIVKPNSPRQLNNLVRRAISILGRPLNERVNKKNFVLTETMLDSY